MKQSPITVRNQVQRSNDNAMPRTRNTLYLLLTLAIHNHGHCGLNPLNDQQLDQQHAGTGLTIDLSVRLGANDAGVSTSSSTTVLIADDDGAPSSDNWQQAGFIRIDDVFGAFNATGLTLDSATDNTTGANYIRIGFPTALEIPYFQIGSVSAESTPTTTNGPKLGGANLQGTFNLSGQLNLWAR